jgi:outer membrane protein assembly factor BamB
MRKLLIAVAAALGVPSLAVADDAAVPTVPLVAPATAERFDALKKTEAPKAADVQTLLSAEAEGARLLRQEDDRFVGLWNSVDRWATGKKAVVDALRREQERDAAVTVAAARKTADVPKLMALYRRYPWSASVHEGLMEAGEHALRRGWHGFAARCFDDVRSHAADAGLRSRATVGLWMALAQDAGDREAFDAAWEGIDEKTFYPWMGKPTAAKEIRARLLTGTEAARAPELAALELRPMSKPTVQPWIIDDTSAFARLARDHRDLLMPHASLTAHPEGVVLSGPNLLACYGDDLTKPRWQHLSTLPFSSGQRVVTPPATFVPAVADGRIFSRWGYKSALRGARGETHRFLKEVLAFSARDGKVLWATGTDAAWEELWPISDPVWAEGRLYVLTSRMAGADEQMPLALVCLDPATGATLWKRELGAVPQLVVPTIRGKRAAIEAIDVTRFGSAVTVAHGAVYLATHGGLLARCDARDGHLEWARTYPREIDADKLLALLRRDASPPLTAGRRVLFLPRDARRLIAVDADSGALSWESKDFDAVRIVGRVGDRAVLADGPRLQGVAVDGGKILWEKRLDETLDRQPSLLGDVVLVGTKSKLYRVKTANGEVAEERAWEKGTLNGLTLMGKALFGLRE